MPDDGPIERGRRRQQQRGDAWYCRIGAAIEAYLFPYDIARRRARIERERALLVAPPVSERFPQRLADLGFVRHTVAAGGEEYITPPCAMLARVHS